MKKSYIFLFIITFLILIAWYRILFQTFTGEGFYYFFRGLEGDSNIFRYDIGAGLFFDLLKPFFRDNFFLYQSIALFTFVLLGILFCFIVYELTQKKSAAFIASILFGVNYNTAFEMIAIGAYQDFVQRVFFLLLLFPSFILFIKFIKNKKITYYVASLILGSLSVGLAYFNFFYIPFLIIYSLGIILTHKMRLKKMFYLLFCTLIYIFIPLLIVVLPSLLNLPNMMPSDNIFAFLVKNTNEIIIHSLRQLTILSVPDAILRQFFSIFNISYTEAIYRSNGIHYFYVPVFLAYLSLGIFLYKREQKLRPAIIASLLFLPSIFILNLYMRTDHVSSLEPGSRYLFVPSIGYSVFWGIFLSHFLGKRRAVIYSIMIVWVILQIAAINEKIQEQSSNHTVTKKIVSYFKNDLSLKLKDDSIVITPYLMGNWGSDYLNMFYGKKNTTFIPRMTPDIEWVTEANRRQLKRSFDPKKDFIVYYDELDQKVADITRNYKMIIKVR